jgi:hypothetical protein
MRKIMINAFFFLFFEKNYKIKESKLDCDIEHR